jgi:metallophosphoesterase (TIGR03767 family)
MHMDRRAFLKATGVMGASALLPWGQLARLEKMGIAPADLTTLGQTIVRGALLAEGSRGSYFGLAAGPGEPHILRTELASGNGKSKVKAKDNLLSFVHFTDIHIIDAQSPARVEFLDRFGDPGNGCESIPFQSAQRPQELLTLHVLEAMIRRIREVAVSPLTGRPFSFVVCTGDNIDNEQFNELRWFIDAMDGGSPLSVNSGGPLYEGVQAATWADPEYWHPEAGVADKYKQQWGFPDYPGLLEDALLPFQATGVGMPWLQTFGNHDGLMQGNAGRNPVFEGIAVAGTKVTGLPPGVDPCDAFQTLRDNPTAFLAAPMQPVTADTDRRIVRRAEYVEEMFNTTGSPAGHGFTQANRDSGVAYWLNDAHPGFRLIGLDTVNPGGYSEGSIGAAQFAWLEQRLIEASGRYFDADGNEVTANVEDRLVILFSHHGLRSLDNPVAAPDPLELGSNDLPRVTAEEVEALVHRFPNVIAWVNGHTHNNVVEPRTSPRGGGFWDIGTAAHIDWSCQSRLIEVVDNGDGTLSIFSTMVDHAAPVAPGGSDPVLNLASISRELAANDFQAGFNSNGAGAPEDRNVELVIAAPFAVRGTKKQTAAASA